MMRKKLLLAIMATAVVSVSMAQKNAQTSSKWRVGVDGGFSFGGASMSSFGQDRTRPEWKAGLVFGHDFNDILSLDVNATFAKLLMDARKCCDEGGSKVETHSMVLLSQEVYLHH